LLFIYVLRHLRERDVNDNIRRVSEKNWTLCYFIISLLRQLQIA